MVPSSSRIRRSAESEAVSLPLVRLVPFVAVDIFEDFEYRAEIAFQLFWFESQLPDMPVSFPAEPFGLCGEAPGYSMTTTSAIDRDMPEPLYLQVGV